MRRINVLSNRAEDVVFRPREAAHRVSALSELRPLLERLPEEDVPALLDLFGHSTRDAKLLRLGATVIDMTRPSIARFFEELVGSGALYRLNVIAVRLLGCETALEPAGQLTIKLLASTLGVPVYGTRSPLIDAHYDAFGFDDCFSSLLREASQLPSPPRRLS